MKRLESGTEKRLKFSWGQSFELAFFKPSKSQNQYSGIWQKYGPYAVVWAANRGSSIKDSDGVLTISKTEGLVLLSQTGSIIWSSNSSIVAENLVAELLDAGNLVLVDNNNNTSSESYLWQSFNYPFNSCLPSMKLEWNEDIGQERYLTLWKNTNDLSSGDFICKIQSDGLPQMGINYGTIKKFQSGPWNGHGKGEDLPLFDGATIATATDNFSEASKSASDRVVLVQFTSAGILSGYWDAAFKGKKEC
ncbi:S-locus lectin protein kinase family protein [Actinidia rufa]|uniref:S-locus lectin protein kinase family protein n=1 Tax=Actinidia rufa TaxID=165716 RepID=A0A7J0G270_9ERIC|nr:S-locus lectin protein kinase family protein [Actinidia rufa]